MRPNWFLGFPLDGAFVSELPALPRNFRRFHCEDVHLTLAFLGPCGEQGAQRALDALDHALHSAPRVALPISLGSVVAMGAPRAYTALSALLGSGREEGERYIAELRDPLTEAASGRRDKRPPKPHVTIARPMRRADEQDRTAGLQWASTVDLSHVVQTLDRIALYTWNELRRERLFRIVAERRLGVQ
jgi:2'-5' RNA ligase